MRRIVPCFMSVATRPPITSTQSPSLNLCIRYPVRIDFQCARSSGPEVISEQDRNGLSWPRLDTPAYCRSIVHSRPVGGEFKGGHLQSNSYSDVIKVNAYHTEASNVQLAKALYGCSNVRSPTVVPRCQPRSLLLVNPTGLPHPKRKCVRLFNPFGKTKAAKRKIPLTAAALAIIKRRTQEAKGAYVFPHRRNKDKPTAWNQKFTSILSHLMNAKPLWLPGFG
jgi:hypothetical protein